MLSIPNLLVLWELYNYYSLLSIAYNSYYYAGVAFYYLVLIKRYIKGDPIPKQDITIQLQSYEDWEIIDILD